MHDGAAFVIIDMNIVTHTVIAVSRENRKRLAAIGDKDSTFNEIISMLLERYEKENKEATA